MRNEPGIFMIKARRCKRCGGLLTSDEALRYGYGHVCRMKVLDEKREKEPQQGQMSFADCGTIEECRAT